MSLYFLDLLRFIVKRGMSRKRRRKKRRKRERKKEEGEGEMEERKYSLLFSNMDLNYMGPLIH